VCKEDEEEEEEEEENNKKVEEESFPRLPRGITMSSLSCQSSQFPSASSPCSINRIKTPSLK
jgi:hypothetical protein